MIPEEYVAESMEPATEWQKHVAETIDCVEENELNVNDKYFKDICARLLNFAKEENEKQWTEELVKKYPDLNGRHQGFSDSISSIKADDDELDALSWVIIYLKTKLWFFKGQKAVINSLSSLYDKLLKK